ncbi:hypothetical protein F4775DRAFT_602941 [Biscogniauxia sp. FL1348]|nr:hypothetical protein F4775DRAFT_602941 [Biscogniauxia sp. FL1348]
MAAHLRIPSTPQAAIFSPSVARAAASTAKDWAYVDDWLRAKYAVLKRRPPPFERNPETLRALLALAAANEAADEERRQLDRVEEAALDEVRRRRAADEQEAAERRQPCGKNADGNDEAAGEDDDQSVDGALLASDLLHAFDDALTREGRTALDAMSDVAVELGIAPQAQISPSPSGSSSASSPSTGTGAALTPESLGRRFVELQGSAYEMDQAARRVDILRCYLDAEGARTSALLSSLRALDLGSGSGSGSSSSSSTDLARQNLETQRRIRAASARLPELRQQVTAFSRAIASSSSSSTTTIPTTTTTSPPQPQHLTVEDVRRDEESYLALLARKRDLDARVRAFAGLPPDLDAARAELERLRADLRALTDARDANFESLVERESPAKGRRVGGGGGGRY